MITNTAPIASHAQIFLRSIAGVFAVIESFLEKKKNESGSNCRHSAAEIVADPALERSATTEFDYCERRAAICLNRSSRFSSRSL